MWVYFLGFHFVSLLFRYFVFLWQRTTQKQKIDNKTHSDLKTAGNRNISHVTHQKFKLLNVIVYMLIKMYTFQKNSGHSKLSTNTYFIYVVWYYFLSVQHISQFDIVYYKHSVLLYTQAQVARGLIIVINPLTTSRDRWLGVIHCVW